MYSIKIKEGVYAGCILTYGKVSLKVADDKGTATLSFSYKVDEVVPPYTEEELNNSNEFRDLLGDILSYIIQTSFDSGKYRIGSNDTNSDDNPSKTTQ